MNGDCYLRNRQIGWGREVACVFDHCSSPPLFVKPQAVTVIVLYDHQVRVPRNHSPASTSAYLGKPVPFILSSEF